MTILSAASTAAEIGGATVVSTAVADFDTTYSDQAAFIQLEGSASSGFVRKFDPPVGDFWGHWLVRLPTSDFASNSGVDGYWFDVLDADGETLCRFEVENGVPFLVAYGDTTVNGVNFTLTNGSKVYVDIKVAVGANIVFEVYYNGVLQSSVTAANTGGKGKPVQVNFDHFDFGAAFAAAGRTIAYSQMIFTDGEPTLGWRMSTLRPDSAGHYSEWDGGYAELGDNSEATRAASDTANQRVSWVPETYAGPVAPVGIRSVLAVAATSKGAIGPQNIKHFLRIGGTDYDGATLAVDGVNFSVEDWDVNPATGAPWSTADLATIEGGLQSIA